MIPHTKTVPFILTFAYHFNVISSVHFLLQVFIETRIDKKHNGRYYGVGLALTFILGGDYRMA